MRTKITSNLAAAATTIITKNTLSPPATTRSPWHSPVPYLFGSLAAMLGLITFALLILACSYWKKRGGGHERDIETGVKKPEKSKDFPGHEKVAVIMAGDEKPTFLATRLCNNRVCLVGKSEKKEEEDVEQKIGTV
ncbi:Glutamine dumper 1 [Heracleum sosnowskyi]|uniref:Glutamine dumper 1 n=1 Tax=Heracleum sosnowskyi TaxID=360622 RepID=A0AAD8HHX8_9APIA|nr:Glutamine dumper 1 [Heracleum sosnowskyi]